MLVHVAEDGRSYDLPCTPDTAVDTLLASLKALTGIPPENQLLICGDVRLEAGRTLAFYQLPDGVHAAGAADSPRGRSSGDDGSSGRPTRPGEPEGRHVFLFNRSRLLPRSLPPEVDPVPEVVMPEVVADLESSSHPFDKSSNPLLRTLPSYERQFRHDLLQAQALLHVSQHRFDACLRLVQEQHTQAMALRTACANMDVTGQHICRSFEEFERSYGQQRDRHASLLGSFQEDLQLLGACSLPSSLRSATGRQSLLEFVKAARLRGAFSECQVAHAQMEARVTELRGQFADIKQGLEAMLRGPHICCESTGEMSPASPGRRDVLDLDSFLQVIDRDMQQGHRSIEEEETGVAILSEDLGTVRRLLQDCLTSLSPSSSPSSSHTERHQHQHQQQGSMQPLDAVAALDPMCTLHSSQLLPRVATCGDQLGALLGRVHSAKVAMTGAVHGHLQLVARLQTRVRDVRNQLHAFREAMAHQEAAFAEMASARGVRRCYAACLAEVVRRHAFGLAYTAKGQELAEALGRMREEEVERRHEFTRQQMLMHSQFGSSVAIPPDLLSAMGLTEAPPPFDISIQSFDSGLIQVSPGDLPSAGRALQGLGRAPGSEEDGEEMPQVDRLVQSYLKGAEQGEPGGGGQNAEPQQQEAGEQIERLLLENTRLRADLAVAHAAEAGQKGAGGGTPGEHWVEALRQKQAEVEQLRGLAEQKQRLVAAYEQRLRDLEALLGEQGQKLALRESQSQTQSQPQSQLQSQSQSQFGAPKAGPEGESPQGSQDAGPKGSEEGSDTRMHPVPRGGAAGGEEEGSGQSSSMCQAGQEASMGSGSVVMGADGDQMESSQLEAAGASFGQLETKKAQAQGHGQGQSANSSSGAGALSGTGTTSDGVPTAAPQGSPKAGLGASSPEDGSSGHGHKGAPSSEDGASSALAVASPDARRCAQGSTSVGDLLSLQGEEAVRLRGNVQILEGQLQEKESELHGKDIQLHEKDSLLHEKDTQVREKDAQLHEKDAQLQDKDTQLQEKDAQLREKETALQEKGAQLQEKEAAVGSLQAQLSDTQMLLQHKEGVLAECQLNCAHIENKLHEAREEARTSRCAAERRAAEYESLRAAAVHTRSLLERLARCLVDPPLAPAPAGRQRDAPASAKDCLYALRSLASSLAPPTSGRPGGAEEGESEEWVRGAVRVIVEGTVQALERAAQSDRNLEELHTRLKHTAGALVEVCDKHEAAKAALRERIALADFQLQDLALFFRTPSGQYQALAAPQPGTVPHFLSQSSLARLHAATITRSVSALPDTPLALQGSFSGSSTGAGAGANLGSASASELADSLVNNAGPPFVVGRIVHIERTAAAAPGPAAADSGGTEGSVPGEGPGMPGTPGMYGLQPGTPFASVSVAMLLDGRP